MTYFRMMEQRYDLSPSRSSSKRISFGERALPSQEQLDEMIMLIDAHVAHRKRSGKSDYFVVLLRNGLNTELVSDEPRHRA
jgi:hypothetical protein